MSRFVSLFIMIPVLAAFLAVPVLIGVYVYRDAARRRMNAVLWTLIAVIAPSLIGFIIYLLVRGNYSDAECPKCGAPATEQYVVCPVCGAKLRPSCPKCSAPVETDWKVCPRCATPISSCQDDIAAPVHHRDKTLWKILAAVIIIPVLLIILAAVSFMTFGSGGSLSVREVTFNEYYDEQESQKISGDVQNWIDSLDIRRDHAYALEYEYSTENGNEYYYLVYVPMAGERGNTSIGQNFGNFGTRLEMKLQSGGSGMLYCLVSSADKAPKLKITVDDRKIPCNVTEVDYNPTLFYIVPEYDEIDLEHGTAEFFMPERMSVVKLIDNGNVGTKEITVEDVKFDILVAIDSSKYLDTDDPIYGLPDGTGGYDFTDGFDIILEYEVRDDMVLHDDMISCMVFEQDGEYYIIDSCRPEDGRIIRQTDGEFYKLLCSLFE